MLTLLRARGLVFDRGGQSAVTSAALLLFGRLPQRFFPNAHIRLLRYEGITAETGSRISVSLDRRIEGTLPTQLSEIRSLLEAQLRQFTVLAPSSGTFEPPRAASFRLVSVVNAVTHRSYSMHGDHIRVRMFDDRLEVESPGGLPGPVRIDNIRRTRFSRNPRIARVLADLGFVRELNEGMNRIYEEMAMAGLREPVLTLQDARFRVTLFSARGWRETAYDLVPVSFTIVVDHLIRHGSITTADASRLSSMSAPTTRRYLRELERRGLVVRVGASSSDPTSYWRLPFAVPAH